MNLHNALVLLVATLALTGCTDEQQNTGNAVLATFGVTGVQPPSYTAPVVSQPVVEQCVPVFRVYACDEDGQEQWP